MSYNGACLAQVLDWNYEQLFQVDNVQLVFVFDSSLPHIFDTFLAESWNTAYPSVPSNNKKQFWDLLVNLIQTYLDFF